MSDSHIYELQDIVWDDFSISDDHLVPYPQIQLQQSEKGGFQKETLKKLKHEAGVGHVGVASEKIVISSPKNASDEMLDYGSSAQKPDACQTYDDPMANLTVNDQTVTKGDFMSTNNLYFGTSYPITNYTAANNHIFPSLSDTHQSERELGFLCNDHENKEISDSLFYEWPEIGSYDLSQMLRSCDSAVGIGDLGVEDDMCWFSSSTVVDGPGAASQSQAMSSYSDSNSVKIFSENCDSPQPTYESPTVDALKKRNAGASYTSSTHPSNNAGQSCLIKLSSINELPTDPDKMDIQKSLQEVNMHTGNMDYQTQPTETKTSLHCVEIPKPALKTQRFSSKASPKLSYSNCSVLQNQTVADITDSDPVSAQKKIFNSENEKCLNKSCQSSKNSFEEKSFHQLQEVVAQMDIKTKLCIRDSLYRLARSAELRHGIATVKADENYSEAPTTGIRQAGLLGIEADTNPMDRYIAHLLFHRPNDSSKMLSSNTRPDRYMNDGGADFHVA